MKTVLSTILLSGLALSQTAFATTFNTKWICQSGQELGMLIAGFNQIVCQDAQKKWRTVTVESVGACTAVSFSKALIRCTSAEPAGSYIGGGAGGALGVGFGAAIFVSKKNGVCLVGEVKAGVSCNISAMKLTISDALNAKPKSIYEDREGGPERYVPSQFHR